MLTCRVEKAVMSADRLLAPIIDCLVELSAPSQYATTLAEYAPLVIGTWQRADVAEVQPETLMRFLIRVQAKDAISCAARKSRTGRRRVGFLGKP